MQVMENWKEFKNVYRLFILILFTISFIFLVQHRLLVNKRYVIFKRSNVTISLKHKSKSTSDLKPNNRSIPLSNTFNSKENQKHLLLFTAIYSYIKNIERRNAIRGTWLKSCKINIETKCLFMIDGIDYKGFPINSTKKEMILNESRIYSDIVLQDSFEGLNFAYRFFISIQWASERYNFDFFLRIDDDHYLCFDRLVYELPFRKKEKYIYWGYEHCEHEITRIDEGWVLFGKSLIQQFLKRKISLICHKYGDQAVPVWILSMKNEINVTWFNDKRIAHSLNYELFLKEISTKDLCSNYLSIHQSYPERMRIFHYVSLRYESSGTPNFTIPTVVDSCPKLHTSFNHKKFERPWYGDVKLCVEKPIWSNQEKFIGRLLV